MDLEANKAVVRRIYEEGYDRGEEGPQGRGL